MNESSANGRRLTWDELDELAEYVAGAITGEPAERVAELIRTDERWAAAHAALAAAEPLVRNALHTASAAPPPLPVEVAARLDAVLGEPVRDGGPTPLRRRRVAPGRPSAPASRSVGARGNRWAGHLRRPVLTRIAAAVLVLAAAGGLTALARELLSAGASGLTAADGSAAERADAASAPTVPPMAGPSVATGDQLDGAHLFASGTDYRRDTLAQLANRPVPFPALDADPSKLRAPGTLSELGTPSRFAECLTAVGLVHPGPVVAVDFARFEGEPAVILVVRHGSTSTVVAVGPHCGADGADILASVEVP